MSTANTDTASKAAAFSTTATVLLVDDEPVSRLSMVARLKRMGLRVLEASNGKEGLAILRRERPDLTILDWVMPEMDGPTVCEQVRQDPDIHSSQLILMTSHDQPEQIAEGLARGADDFLSKSASKQEILARVQSGLRAASLVRNIESTRDQLRIKQAELEGELQSAASYVRSLLPAAGPVAPGIHMSWTYRPSLALGGDLFNCSSWDEHSITFYILDASGHGVSPALRAASLSTFLRADNLRHYMDDSDPARMMAEANRQYPLTEDGSYFTLWIGSFDRRTGQLRYTTAGHGGALIHRQNETVEWLTHSQLPLGFESDTQYKSSAIQVTDGDRVILMSDGIYEAPASTGELWGTTRLEATLMAHRSAPLGEALPALMAEAERWNGSSVFPDDAALLGLEFRL
ncbi:MAG: SpoIIE family protein phosphatase [Nitrospira sp.]|nr:SpoIIE family protein phosphatase [Nitrospira sp.]